MLLAVDLGTGAVKAGVIAPDGTVIATARREIATQRPRPGWAEQDATTWTDAVRQVLAGLPAGGLVAGALCSQVNTHVFVDAAGAPLMPAILWQDIRAAAEAAELDAQVTVAQRLAWWGAPMPIDASHALARMLWVSRHRPEIWAATARVVLPKDLVLHDLTGEWVSDPLANIGLAGADGAHVPDLLALAPGAAERLLPMVPPDRVIGRLRRGTAMPGLPMVAATMDAWTALVGSGGGVEGAGAWVSGTSEVLGIRSASGPGAPGIVVFPQALGARLHAGPTQAGGAAMLWAADLLGLEPGSMVPAAASAATPLFLPQLAGERAPLWDTTLRGALIGMGTATSPDDVVRAVFEGVALSARHVWEGLVASAGVTPTHLTCGGGGFRSDAWAQIRADILGLPLHRLEAGDAGLVGAAALAGVGAGLFPRLDAAVAALGRTGRVFVPDPAARARADDLFGIYKDAITAQAPLARRLAAAIR
jgi:xylulokinase